MPSPSEKLLLKQLHSAISEMHSVGLTGMHDAAVPLDILEFFKKYVNIILFINALK